MPHDITGLHHVGHIVADIGAAADLYRRLGFHVGPPGFPAWKDAPVGQADNNLVPYGAGNTHVEFQRDFVELVTVLDGPLPADAFLMPVEVPESGREKVAHAIRETTRNIRSFLDRFEGLHIAMFDGPEPAATAARLDAGGVAHGGVHHVRRPMWTAEGGTTAVPASYLEIGESARVPEGRIGVASNPGTALLDAQKLPPHPNGAVGLTEIVLCAADDALDEYGERYARILAREPERADHGVDFALDGSRLAIARASALGKVWPGAEVPAVPGFAAFGVAVEDLAATGELLRRNGFSLRETADGGVVVPAAEAMGAAVLFTQA
ncbi:MAG TPA: VOC family protein [Phytomonospora sp.]